MSDNKLMCSVHVWAGDSTLMHYSVKDITSSDTTGVHFWFMVSGYFREGLLME